MSEEPRFAPNGNRLPERLPVGHRLVDTSKKQWIIGPSIGCGGFGDIYLTRQYVENKDDLKRLTQEQITRESATWTNVIKFEHFSGPLFAEIHFYLRCAKQETINEYMTAKKLKHLGVPRYVASGIYDPLRSDNPPPVCKNTVSASSDSAKKPPAAKRGRLVNGKAGAAAANGKPKRVPAAQVKEKKYRFLVLQRFGDDLQKVWSRAHERFDMKSAFNIALKVMDTLEFIHSHGYVHADVKASNLLIEWPGPDTTINGHNKQTNGIQASTDGVNGSADDKPKSRTSRGAKATPASIKRDRATSVSNGLAKANGTSSKSQPGKNSIEPEDQVYLVDYGLVERFYTKDGIHHEHVEDQRRANNGTVEFSSRDAHIGAFSRRSDLESLAYNLLYWVSGGRLPWVGHLKDHELVEASKKWYMDNLEVFVNYCFNEDAEPIDPVKLLRGIDPMMSNGHSSARSSTSHHGNGRTNGRSTNTNNNNNDSPIISTTSTKASTNTSRSSKASTIAKTPKSSSARSTNSSAAASTSSSSAHDSIMCAALYDFLKYISNLSFKTEPDYYLLKSILINALGDGAAARLARKRGSQPIKKTPPKLPGCENPTPAMREILMKMKSKMGVKK